MPEKFTNLRARLDPHDALADLTITTRSGVFNPGRTMCTMRNRGTRRTVGMLQIERQQGELALPTLQITDIETSRGADERSVYFAAWLEMLLLAHDEDRILKSKDTGITHQELAAWQWLAESGVAEVVEPFQILPILGKGAVYYSGTALALPPSLQA